nr:tryptophan--tRNA ligase [Gemmatimonadaceae bacterium]
AGWGCIECKKVLFENMEVELVPIRKRAADVRGNTKLLKESLGRGTERATDVARSTIREVKELMGLA